MKRLSTLCLLAMAQLFSAGAYAATQTFTLYVDAATLPITGAGGAVLDVLSYSDGSGAAMTTVPGPAMSVTEGDTVNVTVVNRHSKTHNFVVQGVTGGGTTVPAGGTYTYTFTAPQAGSYVYAAPSTATSTGKWACTAPWWCGRWTARPPPGAAARLTTSNGFG